MTFRGAGAAVMLAAAVSASPAADPASGSDAAEAVEATIEVERTLLEEDASRHQRLAQQRQRAFERLQELHSALDSALMRRDGAALDTIEALMVQVEQAERERAATLVQERLVGERMIDRIRRIRLLEDRLQILEARVVRETGPLDGRWMVTLMPSNIRGAFTMRQSGTILSGTYQLEGGWTGSLQGTLVDRKVHLIRIDSKLGRSMELEGFLSSDGARIRGTWQSYDLSGDSAPSGQWSAVRPPSDE